MSTKKKQKKKTESKYKGLTGYRLHNRRFRFTHKRGIRTIKFPLKGNEELKKEISQGIKSDYEALYGPLSLSSYVISKEYYSLKDFWIDSLRAGVIFRKNTSELLNTIRTLDGSIDKIDRKQKKLLEKNDKNFANAIEFQKFKKEFILSSQKRATASVNGETLSKKVLKCFKDKDSKYAKDTAKKMGNELYKIIKEKGSESEYWEYWKTKGVDKTMYETDGGGSMTFYILPELDLEEDLENRKCLKRIEETLSKKLPGDKFVLEEYIGISNNSSAFSNYFNEVLKLLRDGSVESIKKYILQTSSMWSGKEDELLKRIKFLSKNAKRLQEIKIASGFQDYRSEFGGKIQSWVSNSYTQEEKIKEQLFGSEEDEKGKIKKGHKQELLEVVEELNKPDYIEINEDNKLQFLKEIVSQMQLKLSKIEGYESLPILELNDYMDLLSDFRQKFNSLFQQVYKSDIDDDEIKTKKKQKTVNSEYKNLFKELRSMPSFIGDVKLSGGGVYDKYLDSHNRLSIGAEFLAKFKEKKQGLKRKNLEDEMEHIEQKLQSILSAYRNAQSEFGKQILRKSLTFAGYNDIDNYKEYDYIWRSKRARENRGEKKESEESIKNLLNNIEDFLNVFCVDWGKYENIIDTNQWLDFVAIEKIRIGLIAYLYDIKSVEKLFTAKLKDKYIKIDVVSSRYRAIDSNAINTIIQTAILSEMKGTLSKLTTNKIISRWVIQPIDSEKKFPLLLTAREKIRKKGEKYLIYFDELKNKQKDSVNSEIKTPKDKVLSSKNLERKYADLNKCLKLETSRHQLQFLDNSFSDAWTEFSPTLASYSFICEEELFISWKNGRPEFKVAEERVYVSIPFKIGFEKKSDKRNQQLEQRKKLLGVDIGEYGVACYLLDSEKLNAKSSRYFIYEPTMRKIREGIKENVKRQKAGTFSIPNTTLKRVRDNAITKVRNKIHNLILKHNARTAYEGEVSAFESGSGKISKIYDSIKQSDVYKKDGLSVDELERNLVWGKDPKSIGSNVSAYATSYMCSKCHKSIYTSIPTNTQEQEDKEWSVHEVKKTSKTSNKKGRTVYRSDVVFSVGKEKIHGYIESEREVKKGNLIKSKEVVKSVKKIFARPPLQMFLQRVSNAKQFKEIGIELLKDKKSTCLFEKKRGSQAIFVCPFCLSIMDADEQAAMWIALKGYLNLHLPTDNKDKNKIRDKIFNNESIRKGWGDADDRVNKLEYLMSYAKEKGILPVYLNSKKYDGYKW